MGTYKSGEETKELILKTCRKLFYEKGYRNTTYQEIAKYANIYPTAIAYHFKSKEVIRDIILNEILFKTGEEAEEYVSDKSLEYFLSGYFLYYKILKCSNYRNFYIECFNESNDISLLSERIETLIPEMYEIYNIKADVNSKSLKKYRLRGLVASSAEEIICRYIGTHPDEYDFIELAELSWNITADLLDIDDNLTKHYYKRVRPLLDGVDFSKLDTTLGEPITHSNKLDENVDSIKNTMQDVSPFTMQDKRAERLMKFCMKPKTRDEMQKYLGLTNREHFRKAYLKPLIESGKLKMTLPDRPNSKNQKYVKK